MSKLHTNTAGGTRCLPVAEVKYFSLSTSKSFPDLKKINGNRSLNNYSELKKSIKNAKLVFQPVLITEDGYILDGQHRVKIVKELWDEGTDVIIGLMALPFKSDSKEVDDILIELQKGHPWTPEDKVRYYACKGNETAKYVLTLANKSCPFLKSGRWGIRNSLVLMGMNPSAFEMDEYISEREVEVCEKLFNELYILLNVGLDRKNKANNWLETLIKAWRRIKLYDADVKLDAEDENGMKYEFSPKAVRGMLDEMGVEELAPNWYPFAIENGAFASSKIGRWLFVFKDSIIDTHNRFAWERSKSCETTA